MGKKSTREGKNAFIKWGAGTATYKAKTGSESDVHRCLGVKWCLGQRMATAKVLAEVKPSLHILRAVRTFCLRAGTGK